MESSEKCMTCGHKEHFCESFALFRELRQKNQLCDVTLKVGDRSISAHRIVLSIFPYFQAMFTNDMVESSKENIRIEQIDPSSLEILINYAYGIDLGIDEDNVQGLMTVASFLQVNRVRDACVEFLISRFEANNVLGIKHLADYIDCPTLIAAANEYIYGHFSDVASAKEFLALEFDELSNLIGQDELNIEGEEFVFEACMKWIKHEVELRAPYLPQLLVKIRLPLLPSHYLLTQLSQEKLIKSSLKCRILLDEANLAPINKKQVYNFQPQFRTKKNFYGEMYVVGGIQINTNYEYVNQFQLLSRIEKYNSAKNEWKLVKEMSVGRYNVGIAALEEKIIVLRGWIGTHRLPAVEVYEPKHNKWSKGQEMLCKKSLVGVAVLSNYVYVCGGFKSSNYLKTVECYCSKSDTWRTVASMNECRSGGSIIGLRGYLYALGGSNGSASDTVERYDPCADLWTNIKPMLCKRYQFGTAVLYGKLYACGGFDGQTYLQTVEVYDPETDVWQLAAPMNCKRRGLALIANMGKLWAFGGFDGESYISSVEFYDLNTGKWSFGPPLPVANAYTGAVILN